MLRYYELGGERIIFTEDEVKDMKVGVREGIATAVQSTSQGPPPALLQRVPSGEGRGLRLVGFKPTSSIKECVHWWEGGIVNASLNWSRVQCAASSIYAPLCSSIPLSAMSLAAH
jgi:hypothetical protein